MLNGRKRTTSLLATLCITGLGGSLLAASPTFAEPDVADVRSRVETLYTEAEQASERYNHARIQLTDARQRLRGLRADLERQRTRTRAIREHLAADLLARYQGQTLSSTAQVLLSEDPDDFLDQLTTIRSHQDQQADLATQFAVESDRLARRERASERELDRIAATEARLAEDQSEIKQKAAAAAELLERLETERAAAAAAASRDAARESVTTGTGEPAEADSAEAEAEAETEVETPQPVAPAPAAASGGAAAAVSYALAQVGDAYVYGASGPDAFDCSGLTSMAWAQAGVALPHSSTAQMSAGTPVSSDQLVPGDLVFYYSPVSHVGIYIGDGQIAHAANPSTGVQVAPVFSMPLSGAVRPG